MTATRLGKDQAEETSATDARLDRGASGAGTGDRGSFDRDPRAVGQDEARPLRTLVDFDSLNGPSVESIGKFRRGCYAILNPRPHA
jgi:hypothetical protein